MNRPSVFVGITRVSSTLRRQELVGRREAWLDAAPGPFLNRHTAADKAAALCARRKLRRLRTFLSRVIHDFESELSQIPGIEPSFVSRGRRDQKRAIRRTSWPVLIARPVQSSASTVRLMQASHFVHAGAKHSVANHQCVTLDHGLQAVTQEDVTDKCLTSPPLVRTD